MKITESKPEQAPSRLKQLAAELHQLETKLRLGGGPEKIERQHKQGKLTARERIDLLLDRDSFRQEIGLLVAYDEYRSADQRPGTGDGENEDEEIGTAPAAGVVTTIGRVGDREVVVVANDATVKAGSWWPETIKKILRAQEIAMRSRVPIIYLVDSAGVNLPFQGGVFPGQYGASRIFYYNSIMRRYLKVPQISAVMGPCIAGGAYLPALSDTIIMVEGTSFMGLGGANLVKGATGQVVDSESLGGARMHTAVSGVAHYMAKNDDDCLSMIRRRFRDLPPAPPSPQGANARLGEEIYGIVPADHRLPYEMEQVIALIFDREDYAEVQAEHAPEMLCANARLAGRPVALIANRRG